MKIQNFLSPSSFNHVSRLIKTGVKNICTDSKSLNLSKAALITFVATSAILACGAFFVEAWLMACTFATISVLSYNLISKNRVIDEIKIQLSDGSQSNSQKEQTIIGLKDRVRQLDTNFSTLDHSYQQLQTEHKDNLNKMMRSLEIMEFCATVAGKCKKALSNAQDKEALASEIESLRSVLSTWIQHFKTLLAKGMPVDHVAQRIFSILKDFEKGRTGELALMLGKLQEVKEQIEASNVNLKSQREELETISKCIREGVAELNEVHQKLAAAYRQLTPVGDPSAYFSPVKVSIFSPTQAQMEV